MSANPVQILLRELGRAPSGAQIGRRWGARLDALSGALDRLGEQVVLFRCGPLVFVSFGLFASLGALLTLLWTGAILVGEGLAPAAFAHLALAGSLALVLGSWLLAQLFDLPLVLRDPVAALRRPVFVSWGGLVPMSFVFGMAALRSGLSPLLYLDALALAIPLGHALGRVGCLSYGCCFGRPTAGRLAVTYRHPLAKAVRVGGRAGERLHPTPFYEILLDLGILLVANLAALLGAPLGTPFALTLLLYGLGRFAIEFLRDNAGRIAVGGLSLGHLFALSHVALAVPCLGLVLLAPETAPAVDWSAALEAAPELAAAAAPCALVIFLGFSIHRGRVGAW